MRREYSYGDKRDMAIDYGIALEKISQLQRILDGAEQEDLETDIKYGWSPTDSKIEINVIRCIFGLETPEELKKLREEAFAAYNRKEAEEDETQKPCDEG